MPKFSALIATVLAFLVVPALAAAAPTATHITDPATTAFVTVIPESPGAFHVAGTTTGGTGNVDLRCYHGAAAGLVASNVPVTNGTFAIDIPTSEALISAVGSPYPFCMLRAVPTGTIPSAPIDMPSNWEGVLIGWGYRGISRLGALSPSTPDAMYDYYIGRTQSGAFNDYDSIASCGFCDTYLVVPGSGAMSNPIWWGNAALYEKPDGVKTRTSVQIDGANAFTSYSAEYNGGSHHLADNPGFPAMTESDSVASANGDLTINESAPFVSCSPDPALYPATDASCSSFATTGVRYERSIAQTDNGRMVTVVDHWKSADGKAHDLDAIYTDTERSVNAGIVGREGRVNFTWSQDGFTKYPANTQIPLPGSVPATMLVKTDASTPDFGDDANPFGSMTFGSQPSEIKLIKIADGSLIGEWEARYQRTIPAGGEITIAFGYTDDFALNPVKTKAQAAEKALTPPTVHVDAPVDGAVVDASSVHVSGTAASADGEFNVTVNGVAASAGGANWSADVPLSEGSNQIIVDVQNDIGVVTNAIVHVTRPAAAAPAQTTAPAGSSGTAATTVAVAPNPIRCVVPKLRGKSLAKAKLLLKRSHCRLGKVARKASARVKPGHVLASRFKAGTRHAAGTRVRVTIAKKA